MTKIYQLKKPPKEALGVETYLAPPPPSQGKIIGLDCHPDTFTAAVFVGQTPHDAGKVGSRENLGLQALLQWAATEFGPQDLFVLEAGSNSFELCTRLHALGLRAVVLESCHVGKHAKTYADNDKMAAARIALVYLAGNAPCVWVPDEWSRQRHELLHAYRKAVDDHTAAGNSLRAYLNGNAIRPARRNLALESTRQWILKQRDWSPLQSEILAEHFGDLDACKERRKRLYRLIAAQMSAEPMMLRCLKVLGVGLINAFALLAVIGNVRRFERLEKLVAYIGLNPGQRQSGTGKNIKLGVGKRGRGDIRHLLIQGAQAVLRMGRATLLGQWGWKLFARKGNRNVAVAAVARKLLVQVWHMLSGNAPTALETDKSGRRRTGCCSQRARWGRALDRAFWCARPVLIRNFRKERKKRLVLLQVIGNKVVIAPSRGRATCRAAFRLGREARPRRQYRYRPRSRSVTGQGRHDRPPRRPAKPGSDALRFTATSKRGIMPGPLEYDLEQILR